MSIQLLSVKCHISGLCRSYTDCLVGHQGAAAAGPSATYCDLVTSRKDTSAGTSWLSLACRWTFEHQNITSRQDLEDMGANDREFFISLLPQGDRTGEPFPQQLEPRFRKCDLQYKRTRKKKRSEAQRLSPFSSSVTFLPSSHRTMAQLPPLDNTHVPPAVTPHFLNLNHPFFQARRCLHRRSYCCSVS